MRNVLKLRFDHSMKQGAGQQETSNSCHITKGKSDGATRQCEKRKIHGGDGHIRVTNPATIEVLVGEKPRAHEPVQVKITIMRRPQIHKDHAVYDHRKYANDRQDTLKLWMRKVMARHITMARIGAHIKSAIQN